MAAKKMQRAARARLLVGTRKGAFVFSSDLRRRRWKIVGPFFKGWEVHHLNYDQRSGRLFAAISTTWWGNDLQVSRNWGRTWQKASRGLHFAAKSGLSVNRIWNITPGQRAGRCLCRGGSRGGVSQ